MMPCRLCRRPAITARVDFGAQPLTNRFLRTADESEYTHPLSVGVCGACGVVQLGAVAPPEELRPRFDWIAYNEAEGHLDDVAQVLAGLRGLTPESTVLGLGLHDGSTLRRLGERGFRNCRQADRAADLGIDHPLGGVESVQQALTGATAERLADKFGRPNLVLLRYVLEHAHDIHELLSCLRTLTAPGGYVLVEVPDATRALERCDYSTVWEEHVFYFTPATLRRCFALAGLEVLFLKSYVYSLENALVAVARAAPAAAPTAPADEDVRRAEDFIGQYPSIRARNVDYFGRLARAEGKAALLGAGHLSAAFINLLGLGDFIDFVADDNPHKQGLFMPGSRAPILPSARLAERGVPLCLMTVRPEVEEAVARKNQAFTACGGRLASIFPGSPYALRAA